LLIEYLLFVKTLIFKTGKELFNVAIGRLAKVGVCDFLAFRTRLFVFRNTNLRRFFSLLKSTSSSFQYAKPLNQLMKALPGEHLVKKII
jgi:hypothetical protein